MHKMMVAALVVVASGLTGCSGDGPPEMVFKTSTFDAFRRVSMTSYNVGEDWTYSDNACVLVADLFKAATTEPDTDDWTTKNVERVAAGVGNMGVTWRHNLSAMGLDGERDAIVETMVDCSEYVAETL